LRILHVFKTYLPDSFAGIERVIWQIAEGCADIGIESEVLSLSANPKANSVHVGRHFAAKSKLLLNFASTGLSADFLGALRSKAREADVIHYHFPWPMMDVAHHLVRPDKPSVLTYHSDIVRQKKLETLYAPIRESFLKQVDHIVATSPNYATTSPVLARFYHKTSVIPIGLDPTGLPRPSADQIEGWRERLGSRFFLFVGALRYYKGIQFLIEAAALCGFPLVIVGHGEMHKEIVQANLPNVTMVGAVSDEDKAALMQLCTAFIFPSHLRSEAFGVALLEAAFAGKPMISCELGTGTSYVNLDGKTGLVVPPADPAALAQAMTVLWQDEVLRATYGAAASRRAFDEFSAAGMVHAYASLYRSLAAGRT
jgi:rhamnosyl/mannosyltransferase